MEKNSHISAAEMKASDIENVNLETGPELSNLVQAELDMSTELDNTLLRLSQVVTGLGLDNTAMSSNNSSGVSEIQRLIRKIQGDGVKVLSLSERLFLMQHTGVAKNLNLTSSSDREAGGG